MAYYGLGAPKWSLVIRYAEPGTLLKRSRTLSGVNLKESEESEDTGYTAPEVEEFVRLYLNVAAGTLQDDYLTAQYNFEEA